MSDWNVDAATGRVFGKYRIVERIGVGGSAQVYLAESGGKYVVVKLLHEHLCHDPKVRRRFIKEASLSAGLSHAHLIRALDFGEEPRPFIAFEYVDGCELSTFAGQGLEPASCCAILDAILDALTYVHSLTDPTGRDLNLVHRDITPANVMIDRNGSVRLGDFGIARSELEHTRTATGVIRGTPRYISPEQACGDPIDQRSDLYGVALIGFELLTGQPFLNAEGELPLIKQAEVAPWRSPSEIVDGVPEQLETFLRRGLARFPELRFDTAAEMKVALEQATEAAAIKPASVDALGQLVRRHVPISKLPQGAPLAQLQTDIAQRAARPPRTSQRAPLAVFGAVMLAVVGAVAAYFAFRSPTQPGTVSSPPAARDISVVIVDSQVADDVTPSRSLDSTSAGPSPDTRVVVSSPKRPTKRIRRPRPKLRRPPPATKTTSPRVPKVPQGNAAAATAMRARLRSMLAALGKRGILKRDIPVQLRQKIAGIKKSLNQGNTDDAAAALTTLDRALAAIAVDENMVRRKARYVGRLVEQAKRSGKDTTQLREQVTTALQVAMDRNYAKANRLLNRMIRKLSSP